MSLRVRYGHGEVGFRISYAVEFVLLHVIFFLLHLVPFRFLDKAAGPLGRFLRRIDRRHVRIAEENLSAAFPDMPKEEISGLIGRLFGNLVRILFEFSHVRRLSRPEYVARNIRLVNFEALEEARKKGRGVVIITSHLGNWELEGAVTCSLGIPLNAIYFQQKNWLADRFFNAIRTRSGIRLIHKKNIFRNVLQALQKNELVAFLSDQDAGRVGAFVPFFGRDASTARGPVYFALKTQAPVIMAHFVRTGMGRYDFILEPVPVTDTGKIEDDIIRNTADWSRMLESMIARYPDQWFWVHRRWKTKKIPEETLA